MNLNSNTKKDKAIEVCEEILKGFEYSSLTISQCLQKCLRVARLLEDREVELWFRLELMGYNYYRIEKDDLLLFNSILSRSGRLTEDGKYYPTSLPDLEDNINLCKEQLKTVVLPSSIAEQSANPNRILSGIDTVVINVRETRRQAMASLVQNQPLFNKIAGAIYQWVVNTYNALRFGNISETIFNEARRLVETELKNISPSTIEKLLKANDRFLSDNPEEWSQGLTSCRRALKSFADAVFPSADVTSDNGHVLTDDKYRNRLIEFVKQAKIKDSQKEILEKQLIYLYDRIKSLDDLASKGVHHVVDRSEGRLCMVHIYLLLAELVKIYKDSKT